MGSVSWIRVLDPPLVSNAVIPCGSGRLQLDNLLPTSRLPVALQSPSRAATEAGSAGSGSSGRPSGGGGIGLGMERAVQLVMIRRSTGQLQRLNLTLKPLEIALEASLLL